MSCISRAGEACRRGPGGLGGAAATGAPRTPYSLGATFKEAKSQAMSARLPASRTTRLAPNSTITRILKSRLSCPRCGDVLSACISAMRHHLLQARLIPGQERATLQLPEKRCQPETSHGNGSHNIEPVHMQLPGKEGRHHEPEGIHQMDAEEHSGNYGERLRSARDLTRQEQDKWQGEVHHHEYHDYP